MKPIAHELSENGFVPDALIRRGIRYKLKQRLADIQANDVEVSSRLQAELAAVMAKSRIAELPDRANQQHYELPVDFFRHVLGKRMKYSSAYWPDQISALDDAESAALEQTCKRAGIKNGMRVLELGCGWGSLTLWMASQYPQAEITAVSNSSTQGNFLRDQLQKAGIKNVTIKTADMNDYIAKQRYDRIVSIEMFEHMRNWPKLFRRISQWLNNDGEFLMHIFLHRNTPYFFEDRDDSDWMSRHFFTGGMMPSADLPLLFQDDIKMNQRWYWSGEHYARTCNAWLQNMDSKKETLWPIVESTYGKDFAKVWWMRWRMFFMACAELFAYNDGQEWFVGHYRFTKRRGR